jgi:CelD/BcsL family acetyltransferase involved in cellulose biosynthesis
MALVDPAVCPRDARCAVETAGARRLFNSDCEIEVLRERAAFDALAAEWTALFARAGRPEHVFQSFAWLSCWADHFLRGSTRLCVVTGRRESRLTMVWPLVETRGLLGRKLAWMGMPLSQYGDALVEGPAAREDLALAWEAICALGADVAVLRKTRRDSNVGAVLGANADACEEATAPFVDFAGRQDFEAVLAKRSAKTRSSRRRLLRRLQETGDIAFVAGAMDQRRESLLRQAFAMKRDWLLRRGLYSGPIESDATLDFFLDFAKRADADVETLIDTVERDGAPVAVGVTFACKGAAVGYLLAHDAEYDKQGAGVLLAEHILQSCFVRGLARYDMLAPYDTYKAEWADDAAPVADFVASFSLRGRLLAWLWRHPLRERAKTALKRMPARYGRFLWPALRAVAGPAGD